jgi:hypothetical protein
MGFELVGGETWETIDETSHRLKVPGGWIIRSYILARVLTGNVSAAMDMIFVKDPNHEWVLPS